MHNISEGHGHCFGNANDAEYWFKATQAGHASLPGLVCPKMIVNTYRL